MDYPDDENGQVLQHMAAQGMDMKAARVLDFEHCFPDAESARAFREAIQSSVLETRVYAPDPERGSGWEVQCRKRMVPTHHAITETEERLGAVARQFGGYPDGWGALSNPDGSPAD